MRAPEGRTPRRRAARGRVAQRVRAKWAARILALGLSAAMLAPAPQQTEAVWVDAEAGTAAFTAITVPRPLNNGPCSIQGSLLNLLGSSLTMRWALPPGVELSAARISYTGSNGLVPVVDTLLGTDLKTVAEGSGYATKLTGRLLNAVLGASRAISVHIVDPSGWVSQTRVVVGDWPLLGLGSATCVDS
ncbi:hypothetical protein ACI1US_02243 [Leucobacter sp. BZR 635]